MFWGCFVDVLGVFWAVLVVFAEFLLGSPRNYFGVTSGSLWGRFGITLG